MSRKTTPKKSTRKKVSRSRKNTKKVPEATTAPAVVDEPPTALDCPPAPPLAEPPAQLPPSVAEIAGHAASAAVEAAVASQEAAHETFGDSRDPEGPRRRVDPSRAFELVEAGEVAPLEVFEGVDPESILAEHLTGSAQADVNVDQLTATLSRVKGKYRGRTVPGGKIGNVDPNISTEEIRRRFGGGRFTMRWLDYANNRVLRSRTFDILGVPRDPSQWERDDDDAPMHAPAGDTEAARALVEISRRLEALETNKQSDLASMLDLTERMMKMSGRGGGEQSAFQLLEIFREGFEQGQQSGSDEKSGDASFWDKALEVIGALGAAGAQQVEEGADVEIDQIHEILDCAKRDDVAGGAELVRDLLSKYGATAAQITVDQISQLVAHKYPTLQQIVQLPETRAFVERVLALLKTGG